MSQVNDTSKKKNILIDDKVAENITRVEELAYELSISEVMTEKVFAISPSMKMMDVVNLFRQERISGAPVVEDGKLIGIISMEDLIHCLCKSDIQANASEYMTTNLFTVRKNDQAIEALKLFVSTRVGRLPVIDEDGSLAGIITKGDLTRGVLKALERDYHEEELIRYRASHLFEDIESTRTSLILRYKILPNDFTHGGAASSYIKRALLRLGASPTIARRCGIAVYEAEMNLIIHTTNGGFIRAEIEPHQITMNAYDTGPGIENVELAMKPGYSTATEEIRELGFGAGMGLYNISRCVDNMVLESQAGKGTMLKIKILLNKEESFSVNPKDEKETPNNES